MVRTSLFGVASTWMAATLTLLSSPVTSQQTLVVGSGGTFGTITAAVNAASPGDTVLVNGGNWFEAIDIDKGIRFVGRGATLRHGIFVPPVQVHDVPAGQMFVMVGFGAHPTSGNDSQVDVRDCDGIVSLQGLTAGGLNRWWLRATNAHQLHVSRCAVRTLGAIDSNLVVEQCVIDPNFASGLSVHNGRAAIVHCSISNGPLPSPPVWLDGAEAAITRTTATASGGNQPAVLADNGAVIIDPSCTLLSQASPTVQGSAANTAFEFASLTTDATGTALAMTAHGPAGAPGLILLSLPQPETATSFGYAWINPSAYGIVSSLVFPAGRLTTSSLPLPPLPPGLTAAMQVAYLAPLGVALSTPSLIVNP